MINRIFIFLALALPIGFFGSSAFAGVDVSLQIECQDGTAVKANDIVGNSYGPVSTYVWIRKPRGQFVYEKVALYLNQRGARSFVLPNMFCAEAITEIRSTQWTLTRSCEGKALPSVGCISRP